MGGAILGASGRTVAVDPSARAAAAQRTRVVQELKAAFGPRFDGTRLQGALDAADAKVLMQLPMVREQGLGRFVQDQLLADTGIQFQFGSEAMNAVGWELGYQTSSLRQQNPMKRAEAQQALEGLTEAADIPNNDLGIRSLAAAIADGKAGRLQAGNGQTMWVKSLSMDSFGR